MVPDRSNASYQPSKLYPVLVGVGSVIAVPPVINETEPVPFPLVASLYEYVSVKVVAVVTADFADSALDA